MRKTTIFASTVLASLALTACGKAAPDGAGSSSDPAKAAVKLAAQFQPGKYRTVTEIRRFDIPGMPQAQIDKMKAMMSQTNGSEYCISAEQAAKGPELMKEQIAKGKCQFEKFDAVGETVDAVFSCQPGAGMSMRATSKGTFTATGSTADITADMTMPGGKSIHTEQRVTTERIGDCT
jgi:Protein of unknown function (DUF3617)